MSGAFATLAGKLILHCKKRLYPKPFGISFRARKEYPDEVTRVACFCSGAVCRHAPASPATAGHAEAGSADAGLVQADHRHALGPGAGQRDPKVAALYRDTLVKAGWAPSDIEIVPVDDTAYMIATWKGSDPSLKPLVLSGHMDVVEAKRADWPRSLRAGGRKRLSLSGAARST
jgi:hypothetical protein